MVQIEDIMLAKHSYHHKFNCNWYMRYNVVYEGVPVNDKTSSVTLGKAQFKIKIKIEGENHI